MKRTLHKEILRLSVPAIVSNVTVPLLGLCDTAISGHLGDSRYLGAIAVGTMMINVLVWLVGFLRMGTTGLVAQYYGGGDTRRMACVLTSSLVVALIVSGVALLFQTPLLESLMYIAGAEESVAHYARRYFRICIWGTPAIMATMAYTGWFIGRQSTLWPMIVAIASNIFNILLSFLLAFPFGLGFEGVAVGTLSANWLGLLLCIIAAKINNKGGRTLASPKEALKNVGLRKFFKVNRDLFFRSACVMIVTMCVTACGARLGNDLLAANAVMMQFFTFFSFFMDGFAFTGEALTGRYYGAGDRTMFRKSVNALLIWAAGIAGVFTLMYIAGWPYITYLLTDVEAVRTTVAQYHIFVILIPCITVAAFIFDGFFIGITRTGTMLVVTLTAMCAFFIVLMFGHKPGGELLDIASNTTLWTGFLLYLFIRGSGLAAAMYTIPFYRKHKQQ